MPRKRIVAHVAMRVRAVSLLLALCAFAAPASAQWVGILKNTPAERFDDTDLRLFLDAGRRVLNEAADKETVRWENPETGSRGELTVLKSFPWKGNSCREIRVYNEAAGSKGSSVQSLCRIEGKWRLVSAAQLKRP